MIESAEGRRGRPERVVMTRIELGEELASQVACPERGLNAHEREKRAMVVLSGLNAP